MSEPPIRECPADWCEHVIRGNQAFAVHAMEWHQGAVEDLIDNHPDELMELIAT